jgi:hypothetical protein
MKFNNVTLINIKINEISKTNDVTSTCRPHRMYTVKKKKSKTADCREGAVDGILGCTELSHP